MSKLLRANFARLWKSKVFRLGMLFMFGVALCVVSEMYKNMSIPDSRIHGDSMLFNGCMYIPIVAAAFIGLFIGGEYSDGTIRNKLIVGHTRNEVYFSNFIVSAAALIMMHLAYIITIICLGFTIVGNVENTFGTLIFIFLISVTTLIAFNAIFLFISMMISSKSNGSVAGLLVSLVLFFAALLIASSLHEPEYYDAYTIKYTDESGEVIEETQERTKNYYYLEGTKREIYEFLYEFLPGCQMFRIANQEDVSGKLAVCSMVIIVSVTAGGIILFNKKDLN